MPGRRIFTATALRAPSAATSARCTCAIEAAATAGPKLAIDLRKRLAERGGDGCFRFGLRERRHLVLQALKIARDLLADHVGAGRQELAELDVSRAEPGERCGEPALAAFGARPLDQPGERDRGLGRQRQRPRVDQREHALAREHEAGARQAGEM